MAGYQQHASANKGQPTNGGAVKTITHSNDRIEWRKEKNAAQLEFEK